MGQEPNGKVMEFEEIGISRFEVGKIVVRWGVPGRIATLLQLGFFP